MIHLATRTAMVDQLRAMLRDSGAERWTDTEIHLAINQAMAHWVGRVSAPLLYSTTFVDGRFEYALPDYIRGVVHPQWNDTDGVWHDYLSYTVQTDGAGNFVLRFFENPGSRTGRLFHYFANGQFPTSATTLTTTIDADDTAAAASATDAPEQGFVRIGDEWMQFAGVTRGATVTLNNLVRGVYGTTAASHSSGAAVEWGIAMPSPDLIEVLGYQVAGYLHRLFLSDGSAQERAQHERMTAYYDGQIQMFWRKWIPRKPRIRLGEPPTWTTIPSYEVCE